MLLQIWKYPLLLLLMWTLMCLNCILLNPLMAVIGRPFFGHKSPAARARELFKHSTDSACLLVDIKKSFLLSVGVFWR